MDPLFQRSIIHFWKIKNDFILQKENGGLVMINFYKKYIDCSPGDSNGTISDIVRKYM